MPAQVDRRRQPQLTLKAIEQVFKDIKWDIKEITSHKFFSPKGDWVNESFGYTLKIPRTMPYIRKLWIGYLAHQELSPGIYAGMNPVPVGTNTPSPLSTGYRLSPEGFDAWILLKQIIPQEQIAEMEQKYGQIELKKKIKEIIIKTYPFSLK